MAIKYQKAERVAGTPSKTTGKNGKKLSAEKCFIL